MSNLAHNPTKQQPPPFFTLPLELREKIYHYIFQTHRSLRAAFPPQPPITHPLTAPPTTPATHLLHLRYRLDDTLGRLHSSFGDGGANQHWLLTNKAIMHEALAHYVRNAEWLYQNLGPWVREKGPHWTTRLPLDARNVRRMELYVISVDFFENRSESQELRGSSNSDLICIADALRDARFNLESLRFVGMSKRLHSGYEGVTCGGQVGTIFSNLRGMFEARGIAVAQFSLGITNCPGSYYWVVYEYTEALGVKLRVHELKRRTKSPDPAPERDLEKLLPEGWVLQREKCGDEMCDGCHPVERETWVPFELTAGSGIKCGCEDHDDDVW